MRDVKLILDQLDSWKSGYLPPSAMILMDEAAKLIREQQESIAVMTEALDEMQKKLNAPAPPKAPAAKTTKPTSVKRTTK